MFILKWIMNFIKFIISEILSLIIKLIFIIFVLVLTISYFGKEEKQILKNNTFLEIDLSKKFLENSIESPLFLDENPTTFFQLINKIEFAKNDNKISGILLLLDGNSLNQTQIYELGDALENFKLSKKSIYSYATSIDNNNFLLNSYVSNSFMPPSAATSVNVTGYNKTLPYFKKLADKFGVNVDVIHVGDFKSYGENYNREYMSKEFKSDLERILKTNYSYFIEEISTNTNSSFKIIDDLVLSGEFMGRSSIDLFNNKFIDKLDYFETLKKQNNIENLLSVENYQLPKKLSSNQIALIYADGDIIYDNKLGVTDSITPNMLIQNLKIAEENPNIKGIVLRINSPGGSALASDIIYDYIKNMTKPVYVSIGSVAASGGYYIAAAGDKIFANKSSLTGSIGVVSLIPNIEKLTEKIGVNFEEISLGNLSNLYSLTDAMTLNREERIFEANLKVYDEFLAKVSEGRKMDKKEVHNIAQGKIWLGKEALDNGLVDSIGGLQSTINSLASDLKLGNTFVVTEISYKENIKSIFKSYVSPIMFFNSIFKITNNNNLEKIIEEEKKLFLPTTYMIF